jgi:hypothetical protein
MWMRGGWSPRFGHGVRRLAVVRSIEQRSAVRRVAVEHFEERTVAGVGERRAEEILGPERL